MRDQLVLLTLSATGAVVAVVLLLTVLVARMIDVDIRVILGLGVL